jgi:hypothetical protein
MQTAMAKGKLVPAEPESPNVAVCPSCKRMVMKRSRKRQGGQTTYFYCHKRGVGIGYPRRYRL